MQAQRLRRVQRRLGHEAGHLAAVLLSRVNQKRMAQVNGAGGARGKSFRPIGGDVQLLREVHKREAGVAKRLEQARDIQMRADADARRRVVHADVGKEEQHQQRATVRLRV